MKEDLNAVSYCIGMSLGGSLAQQNLSMLDVESVAAGIRTILHKEQPKYSYEEAEKLIQDFISKITEEKYSGNKREGIEFLENNKAKSGVFTTDSGLQYEIITEGNGNKPTADSTVEVHYHGTLINGMVFDSSVQRGQTATFGVGQVIKGWTEALQLMSVGSKYRLYIPEELAYGSHPHPGGPIEPHMALIFDVELIDIK